MIATNNDIKRWTIFDVLTGKIYDVTDKDFFDGITNNMIEMRGKFIPVENNNKIWVDGIIKK